MSIRLAASVLVCSALAITPASAITVTATNSANALVSNILGSGVTLVGGPTLVGVTNQQATFASGAAEVGFASGIVLSTGNVNQIPGSNAGQLPAETRGGAGGTTQENINTDLPTGGDLDVESIIPAAQTTFDANSLSFSFQFGDGTQAGNSLFFNFVFASEEYIDYINTQYNDAFGFFLDGVNIAKIGGQNITINTVNDLVNGGSYVNNVINTNGIPFANRQIRFDGLTTVLQVSATNLAAGTHTIKLAIADVGDGLLDAGVFIQAGTFSATPTPVVPEPGFYGALALGLGALYSLKNRIRKA